MNGHFPLPRRAPPFVLGACVVALACVQGIHPPQVAPRGTLAPEVATSAAAAPGGPFRVVFASPRGETLDPSEVSIVFSRPMRSLGLSAKEPPSPAVLRPAVAGSWEWVGTTALRFVPETRLPRATTFAVEVAAAARALDGAALGQAFMFSFATPRPALARSDPHDGAEGVKPDSHVRLWLNGPVDDAALAASVSIDAAAAEGEAPAQAGARKTVAFDVRRPEPGDLALADLVPRAPLPLDREIRIRVAPSLRGTEGPLTANKEKVVSFQTYGPLRVREIACWSTVDREGRCDPGGGVHIKLSNGVRPADLRRALQIDPPVKLPPLSAWHEDGDATTDWFNVPGRFLPARAYTIRLRATMPAAGGKPAGPLRDEHGQAMARDAVQTLAFGDVQPRAAIGVDGTYLEPALRRDVPVFSVNVADLGVAAAPVAPDQVLAFETDRRWSGRPQTVFDEVVRLPGAKVSRTVAPGARNRLAKTFVRTEDLLGGPGGRGPVAIATRWSAAGDGSAAWQVVQVTDLGITAKISPAGSIVWVTRLSSGRPVEGAEVSIRRAGGGAGETFRTDADGLAVVPAGSFQPARGTRETAVVFARAGADWAYRPVESELSGWRYGAPVSWGEHDCAFGMAFSERGIYRPGDSAKVKGIARQEAGKGTATPAGRVVHVEVKDPEGTKILEADEATGSFGTFWREVKIPPTAKIGSYHVSATVQGSPKGCDEISTSFEVAEYRPAEFQVAVETDRPSYVRGDKMTCTARGTYLFGSAMGGAEARHAVTRGATYFQPPDTEGFVTDESAFVEGGRDASPRAGELESGRAKLDAQGRVEAVARLDLPGQRGPENVACEVEVTDLSRQAIASRASAIVHPGDVYVGLKLPGDGFPKAADAIRPEVIVVDPKGVRRGGVAVHVELVQRSWKIVRQATGGGRYHTEATHVDRPAAACDVTSAPTPASCELRIPSGGFFLVRATARDARGHDVGAATGVYALGEGAAGWPDSDDQRVELVPDRKGYEIGQTARVLVKSPFPSAEALVTVERAGVWRQRRMAVAGTMPTVEVPVTDEMVPNAFVSVLLVRGRTKAPPAAEGAPDVGAPAFRLGYAQIGVSHAARKLRVEVRPSRAETRPGAKADVAVEVRDAQGKPARAEVTLYAVDEGVLSLVAYKTPDPLAVFFAPRGLHVHTIEAREAMAHTWRSPAGWEAGLDKGLEGGGGGGPVRRDFRQTALFLPGLVTDAAGRAAASFVLPETLTTFRIMAVAVAEDDRFGSAEARVVTSKPLMVRPSLPRVVRAGDRFEASVVVSSKGLGRARVEVTAAADGVRLVSDAKRSVDLEAGRSEEVRFEIEAARAGAAKLRFHASGGGAEDAVEVRRDVVVPIVPEAVALYGDTTSAVAERLGDIGAIRDDVGGLELSLASSALAGLAGGFDQLVEYPYGCTEQLTSRLVPLLPLRDLARAFGIALPPKVDEAVSATVGKLLSHQRPDGGFGLWPDSRESSPFLTAYALWGLGEARRRGVEVPASAIEAARQYLRAALARWDRSDVERAVAPFALDVLATEGAPDPGYATILFEARDKLPLFSRALLLHAMAVGGSGRKAVEDLAAEVEGSLRIDGAAARAAANEGDRYATVMDSETRTSAIVLRALLAVRPSHPMAARIATGLLADRRGGHWRSTQETAWALLALDAYRRAQEASAPDFDARVWLGPALVASAPFHGASLDGTRATVHAADLAKAGGQTLAFEVAGSGRLFYEARLRFARREMPRTPFENGFFVHKTMRAVLPESLPDALRSAPGPGSTTFSGGDIVLCDLVVVTPSPRNFVVVDDPLPGGLEAVDTRLATTASWNRVEEAAADDDEDEEGARAHERRIAKGQPIAARWDRQEVRDDRVLFFSDHLPAGIFRFRYLARAMSFGTFVLPPTRVEQMYVPETFGRSGADVIRVRGAGRPGQ